MRVGLGSDCLPISAVWDMNGVNDVRLTEAGLCDERQRQIRDYIITRARIPLQR